MPFCVPGNSVETSWYTKTGAAGKFPATPVLNFYTLFVHCRGSIFFTVFSNIIAVQYIDLKRLIQALLYTELLNLLVYEI